MRYVNTSNDKLPVKKLLKDLKLGDHFHWAMGSNTTRCIVTGGPVIFKDCPEVYVPWTVLGEEHSDTAAGIVASGDLGVYTK